MWILNSVTGDYRNLAHLVHFEYASDSYPYQIKLRFNDDVYHNTVTVYFAETAQGLLDAPDFIASLLAGDAAVAKTWSTTDWRVV